MAISTTGRFGNDKASSNDEDPLELFATIVADNLSGRRVLDRASHAMEPEPATLAQLAPMARIQDAIRQLHARRHPANSAAQVAADAVVCALVTEAARRLDPRVATWHEADRALGTLGDLLEQLMAVSPALLDAAPAGSAGITD